ncbi:putative DnaJ-like protein subfamily C member 5B [Hypsibius exemplaris]|uniref:DnaJ-like protein subfamily C member 5B n=1 Tax=Hypsibius exemplaris TaxID=2072580 RepID=A0A1W0X5X3_HYPEX|nr:putative DnaJ-like protein subfamily C member 5B [Hypsibius exemplaris]
MATIGERKLSTTGTSLYEALGLEKGATNEEIKKAYRTLALRNHPDKNPDDPTAADRIRTINYANGVLSDASKRQIYDVYGSMGLSVAEQVGEDRLLMMNGPCFKVCVLLCGVLTGCYCCCCCCCCCRVFRQPMPPKEGEIPTQEDQSTPRGFDHQDSSPHSEMPPPPSYKTTQPK